MISLIALNNLICNMAGNSVGLDSAAVAEVVGYRNEASKHWNAWIFFTILSVKCVCGRDYEL